MALVVKILLVFYITFAKSLSIDFPSLDDAAEFAQLSLLAYIDPSFLGCDDIIASSPSIFNDDLECLYFSPESHVIVVSSRMNNYIGISYRGSIDLEDIIANARVRMVAFGPDPFHSTIPSNRNIQVHNGFNTAVFESYQDVLNTVTSAIKENPDKRIVVTGHSLGAANSILSATALATDLHNHFIESISFGSPMTGNDDWKDYVNSLQNLGIWRFVYLDDIVPRMPGPRFDGYRHPGHTFQFGEERNEVYYLHYGDEQLLYLGAPKTWQSASFDDTRASIKMHFLGRYIKYIKRHSVRNPDIFYKQEFMQVITKSAAIVKRHKNVRVQTTLYHRRKDHRGPHGVW
mmetsp:Transcript_27222/g.33368  ORF Transcript_27222/g.33368 Transcript_27222/m.33368 type:complete len:346 (-) Transcript_27222:415-1452(-)